MAGLMTDLVFCSKIITIIVNCLMKIFKEIGECLKKYRLYDSKKCKFSLCLC